MRNATADEVRVLQHLLSAGLQEYEAYRAQLAGLKVDDRGDNVFYLHPLKEAPSAEPSQNGALVDGTYTDADGIKVEMFIAVEEGRLKFIDVMKLDPRSPIQITFPPNHVIAVKKSGT